VVYDNEFVWGLSRDRENDGNTGDVRIFRQVQVFCKIIVLRHVFLYCLGQLMWWLCLEFGVPLPSFYIQGAEVTRKVLESVTVVVLVGLYL
jgi:hypothetical protein